MNKKKIRQKYKQVKYQHLKKIYSKNLAKLPCNCKYNKQIQLPNRSKINICGFNLEDNFQIDLCYKPEHAKNCNAFCAKSNKEELYREFIEDLRDDQIRSTKYKDVNTLYWVYPDIKFEEFPEEKRLLSLILMWFKSFF